MSTGPINEMIIIITNVIRKTPRGNALFCQSDAGEELFDNWQKILLDSAAIINNSWYAEGDLCDRAIHTFEGAFAAIINPPKENHGQ